MEAIKYTCKPNKCISCETIIHLKGETAEQKKERGVYKELILKLSDGSQMKVGVCNQCDARKDELNKDEMLNAIKELWENTIRLNRLELHKKFTKDLKVIGYA